jgi:glycosyltransferase involved in cell wall biosynthesis
MNDRGTGPAPGQPARGSISVCIPVYNCADVIERAIRSVEAQTLPALEVVAVEDGSSDKSAQVLDRLMAEGRIAAVIRQRNAGVAGARNTAIRRARGEWIVPLDADDALDPHALERSLAAAEHTPGAGWCITDIVRVGAEGEQFFASTPPGGPASDWLPAMLERNFVERTMLLKREMLLQLGGYDPAFRCYEDWELGIRMLRAGVIAAYAPGPLYRYIKTEGSITSDLTRLLNAHEQLFKHHHRPLADTGNPLYRRIYARRMWALGRDHLDQRHDYRAALRCLFTSLRYDFTPAKILQGASQRVFRSVGGRGNPPPPKQDDDVPSSPD